MSTRTGAVVAAGFTAFFVVFFWPAEFGKMMASGDAIVETLPAYLGNHRLWEPDILLGYPMFADPNQQMWYPLAWLHVVPNSFNAFAVLPYVIAATGMTLFVRAITRSTVAGVVSGFVYSLGGFMISHAGHLMLTHPAAWAPFVLWAVESARSARNDLPIVWGAIAVGLCAIAGQPQIVVVTLTIAVAYAAVSCFAVLERRRFVVRVALIVALGLSIAAIQLFPEAQLAFASTRASLSFGAFTLHELPIAQLAMRLVFPYAAGTTADHAYAFSGIAFGPYTELTIASGFAAPALGLLALGRLRDDLRIVFWFVIGTLALVLAIGDATALATLTHALPLYDLFRIPARHAFDWSIALAVLAGYGSRAIADSRISVSHFAWASAAVVVVALAGYAQFTLGASPVASAIASTYGVPIGRVTSPLTNAAIGIPVATGAIALLCVVVAVLLKTRTVFIGALLVVSVALDTGAFAWASYWNSQAVDAAAIAPTAVAREIANRSTAAHTRPAWLPGTNGTAFAPNLTLLWQMRTLDGYTPLVPRRLADMLDPTTAGGYQVPVARDAGPDLAGENPIATSAVPNEALAPDRPFSASDLAVFLSASIAGARTYAEFGLSERRPATTIAMVADLGDSVSIPQATRVATLDIAYVDGRMERHDVVAGRDLSEFEYDRPDVLPLVRHRRARVYDGTGYDHRYVASFDVARYEPIARLAVTWTYPAAHGAITIDKLSLVDAKTRRATSFNSLSALYAAPDHWQPIALDPAIVAFTNARAFPRAWFARPIVATEATAMRAVRFGIAPDGARFVPDRDVVVEATVPNEPPSSPADAAYVFRDDAADVTFATSCARACYLVVRDAFDPNWTVDVDGRRGAIDPADVDLRGVALDAGRHTVAFRFVPISLYAGGAVTFATLLALGAIAARSLGRGRIPGVAT